jgi:predicted acyl esterase
MLNLAVRLCDVHPSGESLRVSYGVLAHRDGHDIPEDCKKWILPPSFHK